MQNIDEPSNPRIAMRYDRGEDRIVPGVDVAGRKDDFGVWVGGEEFGAELGARDVGDGHAVAEELANK